MAVSRPGVSPAAIAAVCLTAVAMGSPAQAQQAMLTGFAERGTSHQLELEARFLELPSSDAFRRHLERITRDPHPLGSDANAAVADYLAETMSAAGLEVERYAYDVYAPLLYPDIDVALVRPIRLPLNTQEYVLDADPSSAHPDARPGWNAYSGSGDVTAEVVYVNYGTREDFQQLAGMGVSVEGRIALARYGANYRGYKAKYAEEAGAAGLIIYSDPANGGFPSGLEYPEGRSWSESAVQRGSVFTLPYNGDPLTPFEPAYTRDSGRRVKRLDPEDLALPRIPITPLPHASAREILSRMEGEPVPRKWQGGLPHTYRLTGGPGLTVRLKVDQPKGLVRAENVVGRLRGSDFPDEWIILGCHYDAWTFGAVDPNGGTAMLLTLAESLGQLARNGQSPRRSILICHWDAEEFGIIGSSEWVEEMRDELDAGAVAYINADVSVSGPSFGAAASPSLKRVVAEATQAVAHPDGGGTVYERWFPPDSEATEPPVGNLGGGSDHLGFYTHVGIPASGLGLHGGSLYHSLYDSFTFFPRFCDPEFVYGPAMARIDGILALRLANADVLPYDVARYAGDLANHLTELEKVAAGRGMETDLSELRAAVASLAAAAGAVDAARAACLAAGARSRRDLAELNAGLIALERAFVHRDGLQGRPWSRSLYASPDPYSGYAAWMLPGLRYEVEDGHAEGVRRWQTIYVDALGELTRRIEGILTALGA